MNYPRLQVRGAIAPSTVVIEISADKGNSPADWDTFKATVSDRSGCLPRVTQMQCSRLELLEKLWGDRSFYSLSPERPNVRVQRLQGAFASSTGLNAVRCNTVVMQQPPQ